MGKQTKAVEEEMIYTSSLSFYTLLLLSIYIIFILKKLITFSHQPRSFPLPPGPRRWPIVGNLLQLGSNHHSTVTEIGKTYGPLSSLKLGTRFLVLASSHQAASEILKTHDRALSGRFVPDAVPYKGKKFDYVSLIWSPESNDDHKHWRSICQAYIFSNKAMMSHTEIREEKVRELLNFIRKMEGKVLKIKEASLLAIFITLVNIMMSTDIISLEEEITGGGFLEILRDSLELFSSSNISDVYPILAPLDLQGLRKKAKVLYKRLTSILEPTIRERREENKGHHSSIQPDFLDGLIELGCSDDHIKVQLVDIIFAGTDATSSTIEWTLVELMKNTQHMMRVQDELASEVKGDIVREHDLHRLSFIDACVKETLRLHPPVPLLVPHRATEQCVVMNYTIPKDTQIIINALAIGRDPDVWEDPLEYKPDRFLDPSVELKRDDTDFIPFGIGRRACPGQVIAAKQVALVVANLIHCFEWSLPNGTGADDIDKVETFHVTLPKKQPLTLIPKMKKSI